MAKNTKNNGVAISNEQRKALTQHVLDALSSDEPRAWAMCWDAAALSPHNPITGTRYRGINRAWLGYLTSELEYGDSRWYTFNELNKAEGLKLRKGSKGAKVEKWAVRTKVRTDADGNNIIDENGNEVTYSYLYLQGMNTVFNGSCVDGLTPLEFAPIADEELFEVADKFIELIKKGGRYTETANGEAYFQPSRNGGKVHLPLRRSFDSARDFVATLLHEFAHATQAQTRMGRKNGAADGSDASYAFEELVAEMASLFVQADLGFTEFGTTVESSLAYLQSWARNCKASNDVVANVAKAMNTAQQVADWIVALYESEFGKMAAAENAAA